jgi:hypothetical protein
MGRPMVKKATNGKNIANKRRMTFHLSENELRRNARRSDQPDRDHGITFIVKHYGPERNVSSSLARSAVCRRKHSLEVTAALVPPSGSA